MMRDILRIVGFSCILAAGILYFTVDKEQASKTDMTASEQELEALRAELVQVKEELAVAQTMSVADQVPENSETGGTPDATPVVKMVLTIESGSNSTDVALLLERAGVIDNATEFETYLSDNGLSGKIQIGEYTVDSAMDFKSIADTITAGR